MRFIGVDLHTTQMTVCYLKTDSQIKQVKVFQLSRVKDFLSDLRADDFVAVEATGNSRWFCQQVRQHTEKVTIVDPHSFEVIKRSVKKTDERDAETLARFLQAGMLPAARERTCQQQEVQSLVQTREKLVQLRTSLINKVHALLVSHGHKEKREHLTSAKGLAAVREKHRWSVAEEVELSVIESQIKSLNEGIKQLDQAIEEAGKKLQGFENIVTIKGIGARSAAVLLSVIGRIDDFATEARLASYFGIVPRVRNSNQTVHHGRITKQGSRVGRKTLVQCTLIAIRWSPYLKKHYEAIKARRGSGKAIIAVARKLLGIIYKTLRNKWMFEDFPNFVLAE